MASNCPKMLRRVLQRNSNIPIDLVRRKRKMKSLNSSFRMLKTLLLQQDDISLQFAKLINELCLQTCIENKLDINLEILYTQFNDFNLQIENENSNDCQKNAMPLESENVQIENPTKFVEKAIYCFKTIVQKMHSEKSQDEFLEEILLLVFRNV